jgi:hypothetical protein
MTKKLTEAEKHANKYIAELRRELKQVAKSETVSRGFLDLFMIAPDGATIRKANKMKITDPCMLEMIEDSKRDLKGYAVKRKDILEEIRAYTASKTVFVVAPNGGTTTEKVSDSACIPLSNKDKAEIHAAIKDMVATGRMIETIKNGEPYYSLNPQHPSFLEHAFEKMTDGRTH